MAPWPPPAGDPRIAPSAHQRTKPQTPCTQLLRSACVSYRPPLAAADLCNPLAPAPSCRPAPLLTPLTPPSISKSSLGSLGTPRRRVGLQGAPGMIAFILLLTGC